MPSRQTLQISAFCSLYVAWAIALLIPVPTEEAAEVLGGADEAFLFGKMVHVSAYGVLTLLGGFMRMPRKRRWLVLGLVSFHGFATEFFQQFVNRHASLRDVGLDHVGISLGILIGWHWWRALFRQKATEPV